MRFHQDAVALKPDVVFIFPDYREDLRKMSQVDMLSHLARIARLAKGSAIPVALGSTLPVGRAKADQAAVNTEKIAALNESIKKLCAVAFYIDCLVRWRRTGFIKLAFAAGRWRVECGG